MKNQFYRFQDDYAKFLREKIKKDFVKGLVDLVLSLEAVIITSRMMDTGLPQTAIIVLVTILGLGYLGKKLKEISNAGNSLGYLRDVEEFISLQEKIKVPITDPVTGKEDYWYLGNLSDINYDSNVGLYKYYASSLEDEEVVEEESARIMGILKGE